MNQNFQSMKCPEGHEALTDGEACPECGALPGLKTEETSKKRFFLQRSKPLKIFIICLSILIITSIVNNLSGSLQGGTASGGSSTDPIYACTNTLANWVIATDVNDMNGSSDTQFVFTFGTQSPIVSWIEGIMGTYIQDSVQQGQTYAQQQIANAAADECNKLSSNGTDISNLPQHP